MFRFGHFRIESTGRVPAGRRRGLHAVRAYRARAAVSLQTRRRGGSGVVAHSHECQGAGIGELLRQELLALRAATPALGTSGDWRYVSDPNHPYPMVYAREYAGEKYIVVLNPSAQRATAQFPEEGAVADIVYGSGVPARYTVRKDLASVKAEPVSATVLRMK